MVKIERAVNGWIVRNKFDDEPEEIHVFDCGDDSVRDNAEAFADVLWKIKELVGPMESRYASARVMIRIEKGDKHADNIEDEANA